MRRRTASSTTITDLAPGFVYDPNLSQRLAHPRTPRPASEGSRSGPGQYGGCVKLKRRSPEKAHSGASQNASLKRRPEPVAYRDQRGWPDDYARCFACSWTRIGQKRSGITRGAPEHRSIEGRTDVAMAESSIRRCASVNRFSALRAMDSPFFRSVMAAPCAHAGNGKGRPVKRYPMASAITALTFLRQPDVSSVLDWS